MTLVNILVNVHYQKSSASDLKQTYTQAINGQYLSQV